MEDFSIGAFWQGRPETPDAVARRLKSLIGSLREITPEFRRWYHVISEDNVPELDETENWLVSAVAARVAKDDLGAPVPAFGYFLVTTNTPSTAPPRNSDVFLATHAGDVSVNKSALYARAGQNWDPALLKYSVVKQTMLALSRAFEPLWCDAGTSDMSKVLDFSVYKQGPVLTPAWMVHLSPPLAARITPPSDVTCERFDDGSMFLAVTEQTFDPDNAEHVAAAFRLFAVLDPLQEKKPREQWRR